jgi:hypothetical protein
VPSGVLLELSPMLGNLNVEFHAGELFPRLGFIATSLETPSREVVRFNDKRVSKRYQCSHFRCSVRPLGQHTVAASDLGFRPSQNL